MSDHAIFVIEKLKIIAQQELEERVEKHLKDVFYKKILPKVISEIKQNLIIDLVNDDESLELTIKIKTDQ